MTEKFTKIKRRNIITGYTQW